MKKVPGKEHIAKAMNIVPEISFGYEINIYNLQKRLLIVNDNEEKYFKISSIKAFKTE